LDHYDFVYRIGEGIKNVGNHTAVFATIITRNASMHCSDYTFI